MQCKDIPDQAFLDAVLATPGVTGTDATAPDSWRMRWMVRETLETALGHAIPEKLFLAKAKTLVRRGFLGGCGCGCRGDYHIPAAGSLGCCYACRRATATVAANAFRALGGQMP